MELAVIAGGPLICHYLNVGIVSHAINLVSAAKQFIWADIAEYRQSTSDPNHQAADCPHRQSQ